MRLFAATLAAAVVLTAQAAASQPPASILGVVWYEGRTTAVARLDPVTLEPLAQSVKVPGPAGFVARSPDGRHALFGVDETGTRLRLLDVDTLRWGRAFSTSGWGGEWAMWVNPDTLVAINPAAVPWVSVIDPTTGRQKSMRVLRGAVVTVARAPHALVAILSPRDTIGRARLAVVDERGAVRSVPLRQLSAGSTMISQQPYHVRVRIPGLAVDPEGRRAVVVPATGPAVEVDLQTLAVSAHPLATRSLALREKLAEGTWRNADWFGRFVVVTGANGDGSEAGRTEPVGAWLIDTRDWSVRLVDPAASEATVAGGRLVVTSETIDEQRFRIDALHVAGFDLEGRRLYRFDVSGFAWLARAVDRYLYVGFEDARRYEIFDAATGAPVRTITPAHPVSIVGES